MSSFPFDWIKPGERQYNVTGDFIVKGKYTTLLAFIRRYILFKKPIFWMK